MRTPWFAAVAALTLAMGVAAEAAQKRARPYRAAPAPVHSWTGCYAGAGAGYGVTNEETALVTAATGAIVVDGITGGARGWLATGQLGCDYQLGGGWSEWVIGAFADADWASIKGRHTGGNVNIGLQQGDERLRWSWAIGGRVGWLVRPQLLSFVSAGYTQATFGEVNYRFAIVPVIGAPTGLQLPSRTHQGWFVGGGLEYALGWLPGLFWKTEYRFASYNTRTDRVMCIGAGCGAIGPTAFAERNRPYVQTARSELVWRFNWGSVLSARY